jgi:ParB family chromosome partitioning protein
MSGKERGLGRGLGALLGESVIPAHEEEDSALTVMPITDLAPGPFQPRQFFDETELEALAASIEEHGIMQPILVRANPDSPGDYQIIAGERRWRAAQLARLHEVPVIVRPMDDRDALEVALIENVQREDLKPLEEAEGYRRLIDEFGITQEELARAVGKSRSHVANAMRLLTLPDPVRMLLDTGMLSAGHARALLGAPEPVSLAKKVAKKGLNVRQTEALVKRATNPPPRALRPAQSADVGRLEDDLTQTLGLKVSIADRGGRGEVKIVYGSLEQLDSVIERLRSNVVSVIQLPEH